jgi:hypothetical protein
MTASLLVVGLLGATALEGARAPGGAATRGLLAAAIAVLVVLHLATIARVVRTGSAPRVDIGTTTISAVRLWWDGGNPYRASLDTIAGAAFPHGEGFAFFRGFKYGPAMIWAYAPGVVIRGTTGYFVSSCVPSLPCGGAGPQRRGRWP